MLRDWSLLFRPLSSAVLFVVLLVSRVSAGVAAPAEEADQGTRVPADADRIYFLEGGEARFQGMYPEGVYPFYIPEHWTIGAGASLSLEVRQSELVRNSNLTVSVNGTTLKTLPLPSIGTEALTIPVADGVLEPGWNSVRLQFLLRISDEPCKDLDNPGLWAAVAAGSHLVVPHTDAALVPDLALFPGSYLSPTADASRPGVTFLMPPKPTPEGLEAAMVLAARLGQTRAVRGKSVRGVMLAGAAPPGISETHLVFVGDVSQLASLEAVGIPPAPVLSAYEALAKAHSRTAHLAVLIEQVSPLNPGRRLLVATAADPEGLAILRANLGQRASIEQLTGSSQVFPSRPPAPKSADEGDSMVTLASLSQGDLTVRGLSTRVVGFKVPVPRHWHLTEQAYLKLYLDHSISPRKSSTFEVDLNGAPVYSLELVPEAGIETTRAQELTIPIPANLRDARMLEVAFRFYVDVGSEDCSRPYDDSAWAVVRNNSFFYLAHEVAPGPDLSQYPDLFAREGDLSGTGLVLGTGAGAGELSTLLSAAAVLGSRVWRADSLALAATTWEALEAASAASLTGRDWIMAGRVNLAPSLRARSGMLPAPLDAAGRLGFMFGRAHPLPEGAAEAGILQVVQSPWDAGRAVLLATAPSEVGMDLNATVLGEPWAEGQLDGNVTLVTSEKQSYHYDIRVESAPGPKVAEPEPSRSSWAWLLVSLAGFGLATALYRAARRGP